MNINFKDNLVEITDAVNFNLERTLDCGQAFRWKLDPNGIWSGMACGRFLRATQKENTVILYTTKKDFEEFWFAYFDLGRDYESICDSFSTNNILKDSLSYGKGIRILKQEPWEALCSFIISQNNNIPRIKGIIERLCFYFGDITEYGEYTFPTAKKIAALTVDDLAVLRSGFRAKYILDAAKKVSDGTIDLNRIANLKTDQAREQLTKIYGVGNKVADCTLLFGMGHLNAFPKDVWIKRAIDKLFDGKFPKKLDEYAGVAQQYLFYYARWTKLDI